MEERFTKIGIIGKLSDERVADTIRHLVIDLGGRGKEVYVDEATVEALLPNSDFNRLSRQEIGTATDLCIVVGGDGTLLNAARLIAAHDVPLLGFNLGRLGFLTDVSPEDITSKLDEIFAGHYSEESRGLLQVSIFRQGQMISESCAFNDVVVHKWNGARMLEYETVIDKQFVNSTRSDGLIVSTPTGSTGYALSGGGPILHPCLHAMVLVPICPHTMSYRPIVVHADSNIDITVIDCNQAEAQVTCDGQINLGLQTGDRIHISKYGHNVLLIHPQDYDYYSILRAKLHWGKRLSD